MPKPEQNKISIPLELTQLNQWTSYNGTVDPVTGKIDKTPTHNPGYPKKGMSFKDAYETNRFGFMFSKEDPYVGIDIDDIDSLDKLGEVDPAFLDLLCKTNAYIEISPSGHGLRSIFKIMGDKPKRAVFKAKHFDGQLTIHTNYLTFTNDCINENPDIPLVSLSDFEGSFKIVEVAEVIDIVDHLPSNTQLPSIAAIEDALVKIPLDQNPRVKRVYEQLWDAKYSHYDFWLNILMALHNYAVVSGSHQHCMQLAIVWSSQDPKHPDDSASVLTKWKSFSEKDSTVSYLTLLKIGNLLKFTWPVPAMNKEGYTGYPVTQNYQNFEYFMDHHIIKIVQDAMSRQYYITGDSDVCEEFFTIPDAIQFGNYYGPVPKKDFINRMWFLAQKRGFGSIPQSHITPSIKTWLTFQHVTFDPIKEWLNTDFDLLAPGLQRDDDIGDYSQYDSVSTFDTIFSAFHFPAGTESKQDKYKKLLKTFFMGFLKIRYYTGRFDQNCGLLLLTGPEASRKTTFFQMLLPKILADKYVRSTTENMQSDKSRRDAISMGANYAYLVYDEFESMYAGKGEGLIKQFLSSHKTASVEIYSKEPTDRVKYAMLGGTTNTKKLPLKKEGTRRIWTIPVMFIDTDILRKFNWHYFYTELKKEYDQIMSTKPKVFPWAIDDNMIDWLNKENAGYSTKSDLEYAIRRTFPIEEDFPGFHVIKSARKSGEYLKKTTDIMTALRFTHSNLQFKESELHHILEHYCGLYTGTLGKAIHIMKPKCIVDRGLMMSGSAKRPDQYKLWVLPPIMSDSGMSENLP